MQVLVLLILIRLSIIEMPTNPFFHYIGILYKNMTLKLRFPNTQYARPFVVVPLTCQGYLRTIICAVHMALINTVILRHVMIS